MAGVNKVILVGNLGQEPDVKSTNNGNAVANFSVATSDRYQDKQTNEWVEKTEWHRVVMWGRQAEIAGQYLAKGSKVYLEGKLQTRSYEKDGETRYVTEVVAFQMQMLDGRRDGGGAPQPQPQQKPASSEDDFDDDIPF